MTYELLIGDRSYSSWSLRGGLLMALSGAAHRTRLIEMYTPAFDAFRDAHPPARQVPTLLIEGEPVWDTLAIAETLAERHPDAGLWPADARQRAAARSLSAEMHASFRALRDRPSMNLRRVYTDFEPTDAENADAQRVQALWAWARGLSGGAYLFGDAPGAVDAMFAPVATRFVTYGFDMTEDARAYVEAIYRWPAFRQWVAMALASPREIALYDRDAQWTAGGHTPHAAPAAIHDGSTTDAINAHCPFSGKAVVAHGLARIGDRVVGFCNSFCRDKTIADAGAWPAVTALLKDR